MSFFVSVGFVLSFFFLFSFFDWLQRRRSFLYLSLHFCLRIEDAIVGFLWREGLVKVDSVSVGTWVRVSLKVVGPRS